MVLTFALLTVICCHLLALPEVRSTEAEDGEGEQVQDLYCGDKNCYDRLGVKRDSSKSDITKAYRKLAAKYHPDRFKDVASKEEASQKFLKIAAAYEVLKDDEPREEYNYMLDNPDEMWRNYYRYYRRRVGPKVDVRLVILLTIALISAGQYYSGHSRYREAIDYFVTVPKYRMHALDIAKQKGLLSSSNATVKVSGVSSKEVKAAAKAREEKLIRQIVEEKMMVGGACAKPKLQDVLALQILLLPYTACDWIRFNVRWLYVYTLCRHAYSEGDKLYLIRRNLALSQSDFDSLPPDEVEKYVSLELWDKEKHRAWHAENEERARLKMIESSRYKQYKRYLRKGGPERMTFDDS